ncbi:uncharacterized protein DSM5745_09416 [Aspergillus mulundensis]|uniref:Uncharacterized protein n=1 Tax=Aspergillus mulundensis TaxID=1810919 RepID=A0A3D8QV80_9EURO|nr:hypothetical protein DSM5745_09416 [Aspergillus mulundensis]RDW65677.1 hypothetical protein DSM5745_09416 [Aspergillus mulundensis]
MPGGGIEANLEGAQSTTWTGYLNATSQPLNWTPSNADGNGKPFAAQSSMTAISSAGPDPATIDTYGHARDSDLIYTTMDGDESAQNPLAHPTPNAGSFTKETLASSKMDIDQVSMPTYPNFMDLSGGDLDVIDWDLLNNQLDGVDAQTIDWDEFEKCMAQFTSQGPSITNGDLHAPQGAPQSTGPSPLSPQASNQQLLVPQADHEQANQVPTEYHLQPHSAPVPGATTTATATGTPTPTQSASAAPVPAATSPPAVVGNAPLAATECDKAQLTQQLTDAWKEIERLRATVQDQAGRLEENERHGSQLHKQYIDRLAECKSELLAKEVEAEGAKWRCLEQEAEIVRYKDKLDSCQAELLSCMKKMHARKTKPMDAGGLQDQFDACKKELNSCKKEAELLRVELEVAGNKIAYMEKHIAEITAAAGSFP